MLYVKAQTIETLADVQAALGNAIQLELSTIPPYLTALYSIDPSNTTNTRIAALIRSIAIEEMLHMAIACNVLNAIGGTPAINVTGFPPTYPGQLPMDIGTQPGGPPFIVSLQKFSIDAVTGTFMVIEEPEDPIVFKTAALTAGVPDFQTIGQFYTAVSTVIANLGETIFTGSPALQVTGWFDSDELFPVTSVASAQQAISIRARGRRRARSTRKASLRTITSSRRSRKASSSCPIPARRTATRTPALRFRSIRTASFRWSWILRRSRCRPDRWSRRWRISSTRHTAHCSTR